MWKIDKKPLVAAVLGLTMILTAACKTVADADDPGRAGAFGGTSDSGKISASGETAGSGSESDRTGSTHTGNVIGSGRTVDLTEGIVANTVSVSEEDPAATVAATDFGLRMLQGDMQAGENVLISPASVLFALGMTMNGARGDTLAQFEDVLGMSVDELNFYLYAYRQSLPHEKNCKVTSANSIWLNEEIVQSVLPDFLQQNADYYAAGIYEAPFDDSTRDDINNWVEKNTDGMIRDILDSIPENTEMYLINAMAFDAKWEKAYKKEQVREGRFIKESGAVQDVTFLNSEEGRYLEDEHAVGFLKYYKGGKYAFAALLPEEGLSLQDYIGSLTGERLNRMIRNPEKTTVQAAIPVFEAEYSTELAQTLSEMGMPDAFSRTAADFSGMTDGDAELYINRVLHKTYINVDANGTKAGAATAVEMRNQGVMEIEDKVVRLDRPFVYFLVDCQEGLPIFMGTVYKVE